MQGICAWGNIDGWTMTASSTSSSILLDMIMPSSRLPRDRSDCCARSMPLLLLLLLMLPLRRLQRRILLGRMRSMQIQCRHSRSCCCHRFLWVMEETKRQLLRHDMSAEVTQEKVSACDNVTRSPNNCGMNTSSTAGSPCSPSRTIRNAVLTTPSCSRWMSASKKATPVDNGKRALLAVGKEKHKWEKLNLLLPQHEQPRIYALSRKSVISKVTTKLSSSPMAAVKNAPMRSPLSTWYCCPSHSSGESPWEASSVGMEEVKGEEDGPSSLCSRR